MASWRTHAFLPARPRDVPGKHLRAAARPDRVHDFSKYKPSTIYRRFARRMAVHQIDSIDAYVNYSSTPAQAEALLPALLIAPVFFATRGVSGCWLS
ncbi:MAG: hypothetical protein IPH54_22345 [Rhodoferax sp.]|nr:hypothetical protein [Rhodoferax sp.]